MKKPIVGFLLLSFCVLVSLFFHVPIYSDEPAYSLPEINITAKTPTGYDKPVKDMASSVSVVTREDIMSVYTNSTPDLLNGLPGVFIQKTGAFGRSDIAIRGIGNNGRQLAVLIDGRTTKMGIYGCAVTHCLPLDNVERIEIIRGPSPVLYGSDAFGGVVNIITKKAEKEFEGLIQASGGSFNTKALQLHLGGNKEKWDYYMTSDYRESDGHMDNSDYHGGNFTGRLGVDLSESLYAVLNVKYFDGKKCEPLRSTDPILPLSDVWNIYERGAVDLSFEHKWNDWDNRVKVYRNFGEHRFSDGWHSKDYTNGILTSATTFPAPENILTFGAEYKNQGGERISTPSGEWDKKDFSLYMHDEHSLSEKVIIVGGVRYCNDEIADDIFSYQGGLVYHVFEKTTVRINAAKGYRAPFINELYLFPSSSTDLDAEKVTNIEAGIRQVISPGAEVEFVVFQMEGSDLIALAVNDDPPPLMKFENVGSFTFKGTETTLYVYPFSWLRGHVSYSTLDPEERTTGRPGKMFDVTLFAGTAKHSVTLTAQHVDDYFASDDEKQPIPSFTVVNIRGESEIAEGLSLFAAVNNLFDEDYVIYADLPSGAAGTYAMPGRSVVTGLNYRF
ncbi:MAG: TonB-dependent receptor [Candidatus Aureabacteria bacterium]|nr:TonB-dependent receptor [Candidatus Auribacterota bacterium]